MQLRKAADILKRCEQELQEILREAAATGDYEPLLRVAEWTRKVAVLASDAECTALTAGVSDNTRAAAIGSTDSKSRKRNISTVRTTTSLAKSSTRNLQKKTIRDKAAYPKFVKRRDHLIKVAWSRKEKKEYQHKVPHSTVLLFVDAIAEAGKDGRVVQMSDLLPIREPDGSEIPSYQSYLVLAWLRSAGLVDQHGRQGYSIRCSDTLQSAVKPGWNTLPEI